MSGFSRSLMAAAVMFGLVPHAIDSISGWTRWNHKPFVSAAQSKRAAKKRKVARARSCKRRTGR